MHRDGCHWYASSYSCECGATAESYDERDIKGNPYSMIWMNPEEREEPCKRCEELLSGAEIEHRVEIHEKS